MEDQRVNNEEQGSVINEIPHAGSETHRFDSGLRQFGAFTNSESFSIDELNRVKNCFLSGMGSLVNRTTDITIQKCISTRSLTGKVRLNSHKIFYNAMLEKCSGDANVRYCWYGASRSEIRGIQCHGFTGVGKLAGDGEMYGIGVYLSHSNFPIDSVLSSEVDEFGFRHVMFCSVILGKVEEVAAGSKQFHPSSTEFDSGVNNLAAPSRYIVWSCSMNFQIYPQYVVSFRFPLCEVPRTGPPNPFQFMASTIIDILSMFLDPSKMTMITSIHTAFQNNGIQYAEFLRDVERFSGCKLLVSITKSLGA